MCASEKPHQRTTPAWQSQKNTLVEDRTQASSEKAPALWTHSWKGRVVWWGGPSSRAVLTESICTCLTTRWTGKQPSEREPGTGICFNPKRVHNAQAVNNSDINITRCPQYPEHFHLIYVTNLRCRYFPSRKWGLRLQVHVYTANNLQGKKLNVGL